MTPGHAHRGPPKVECNLRNGSGREHFRMGSWAFKKGEKKKKEFQEKNKLLVVDTMRGGGVGGGGLLDQEGSIAASTNS